MAATTSSRLLRGFFDKGLKREAAIVLESTAMLVSHMSYSWNFFSHLGTVLRLRIRTDTVISYEGICDSRKKWNTVALPSIISALLQCGTTLTTTIIDGAIHTASTGQAMCLTTVLASYMEVEKHLPQSMSRHLFLGRSGHRRSGRPGGRKGLSTKHNSHLSPHGVNRGEPLAL